MDDKRPPHATHWPASAASHAPPLPPHLQPALAAQQLSLAQPLAQLYPSPPPSHPVSAQTPSPRLLPRQAFAPPLPPILPSKRPYDDDEWPQHQHPHQHPQQHPHPQQQQHHTHPQQHHHHHQPQPPPPQPHPKQVRLGPMRSAPQHPPRQDVYQPPPDASPRRRPYPPENSPLARRFAPDPFDDDKLAYASPRRAPSSADSFVIAAEMGARAQATVDNAAGDVFETYELGKSIVSTSKLYANQRRSNRQLPGGSDSTTAACYMIGGTPDSVLSPLLARVSACDPREERCKAVERVLKDKTRGAICALNGENPREARADNLAAVRICEVVADVLVAYSARKVLESRKELHNQVQRQERVIKDLRDELANERRKRHERDAECWCKGQPPENRPVVTQPIGDLHSFERNKLLRRGVLTSSGHRSIDSDRASLGEPADKDADPAKFDAH